MSRENSGVDLSDDERRALKSMAEWWQDSQMGRRAALGGTAAALGAASFGAGRATAQPSGSEGVIGQQNDRVDAWIDEADINSISGSAAGGGSSIADLLGDGMVVPVGDGIGSGDAIDPSTTSTPVEDALAVVEGLTSRAAVLLPPEVSDDGPIYMRQQVSLVAPFGCNLDITGSGDGLVWDTSQVPHSGPYFIGTDITGYLQINGQGDTAGQGDALHWIDGMAEAQWDHVKIRSWDGVAWNHEDNVGNFENQYRMLGFENIDAGDEAGVMREAGGGALQDFGLIYAAPSDSGSGSPSDIIRSDTGTISSGTIDTMNIGGTSGRVVRGSIAASGLNIGRVNWECPSTILHLFTPQGRLNVFGLKVGGSGTIESTIYRLSTGTSDFLANPRINATLNGVIVDIQTEPGGSNYSLIFAGNSGDVTNSSGNTLDPGVACLADQTMVTDPT